MLVGVLSTFAQTMASDLVSQTRMVLTSSLVSDLKSALKTSSPRELCIAILEKIRAFIAANNSPATKRLLVKIALIITSLYLAWKGGKRLLTAPVPYLEDLSIVSYLTVKVSAAPEMGARRHINEEILRAFDAVEEEQGEEVEGEPLTRSTYVAEAAMIAKAVFGTPDRSAANDQAIRTFLRRLFRDTDHRKTHVARDIILAIELVYTHTMSELEAVRFRYSSARMKRQVLVGESHLRFAQ